MPFEVPEGWVWCKLGDLFDVVSAKRVLKSDWTNKGIPFYRAREIVQLHKDGVADKDLFITEKLFAELKEKFGIPEAEDIMISAVGSIGYTYIVNEKDSFYYKDASVLCMKNVNRLNSLYFSRLFESTFVKEQMYDNSKGTTVDTITIEKIRKYVVPFPPLAEQQRIVAEIEKWFALIAQIEQRKTDLQVTIKQAKSKILDLAIHGKLVPQDPNDEPASELLKRINPKAEITCDNGHYENLPKGWTTCRLEDIISYEQPTAFIVGSTNYDDSYSIPVLTAGKSFIIGYTNETKGVYSTLPCIIFDDFTTDSKLVNFPFKVKSSAMKILQVLPDLEIEYVSMFMSITRLIGDTHKRYWISEYSKIEIPIPPFAEQKRIVAAIKSVFAKLDTIMESL